MSEKIIELSQVIEEITNENYEKAAEILLDLNTKYPKNQDILYYLGLVHNHMFKPDDAIEFYKEYLKINPEGPGGFAGIGLAFYMKEDWVQALQYFEQAKNISPNVETLFYIAEIYFELNQYEKSISYYNIILSEQYQDIMKADEKILLGLAKCFIGLEKPKQALNMLQICESHNLKSEMFYRLSGVANFMMENWNEAIEKFEQYLKILPESEDITTLLNEAKSKIGN